MKLAVGTVLFFLGFAQFSWRQTNGSTNLGSPDSSAPASSPNSYAVFGASPQQQALVRSQIQIMPPTVLPLRVFFVPHWKYVDNTRIFHLHVPTGYTSAVFTHLPSRSVFVDADRYVSNESLGYWLAHELGHLAVNSTKEEEAERAACELRGRLEEVRKRQQLTSAQSVLLKIVRDSTERFKDVSAAEAEGYSLLFGCVSGPDAEAMELHFVNMFYTLHAWAWKENPNGAFVNWHPNVSCQAFAGQ